MGGGRGSTLFLLLYFDFISREAFLHIHFIALGIQTFWSNIKRNSLKNVAIAFHTTIYSMNSYFHETQKAFSTRHVVAVDVNATIRFWQMWRHATDWSRNWPFSAFVIHFSFVACFFWLNVICIETWLMVRYHVNQRSYNRVSPKLMFFYYSIWAWGSSVILILVSMAMDLNPTIPTTYVKPSFGSDSCWFKCKSRFAERNLFVSLVPHHHLEHAVIWPDHSKHHANLINTARWEAQITTRSSFTKNPNVSQHHKHHRASFHLASLTG